MLSEQEHGVKVHRQQVWPDAEYQTAAELLLPGPGDPAKWQKVLPNLGAEPDVTAPTSSLNMLQNYVSSFVPHS